MKKIFTLAAAASMVLVANAGTRVLYTQDFESVNDAKDAGWSYGGASMDIVGDDFGQFLQLNQGATNGRNAAVKWGSDIYGENGSILEDGVYTFSFDFYPQLSSNNQYNSAITVFSNHEAPANQPYIGRWTYLKDAEGNEIKEGYCGYLFDLSQVQRETEDVNSIQLMVNGDENDQITLNSEWYTITLVVDVNNRTVQYEVATLMGAIATSGTRTVPENEVDGTPNSMYAEGLNIMVARYQAIFCLDNLKITCESSQDVANDPSVALTRVGKDADGNLDLAHRAYTINFIEGELLHVLGTDGVETPVSFFDCDGIYEYTTTTSGTLKVWTTCGNATSNVIEVEVDCAPIVLPVAEANIISVVSGYGKTYKLAVDNSKVLLSPQIFITYKFVGDAGEIVEAEEVGAGHTFTVTQPGTLTLTTKAFGYQEATATVKNDAEYTERYIVDFARMTADQIAEAGFAKDEDLNSATQSGEQNWTARKRLFYYVAGSEYVDETTGETKLDAAYPFGFVAEDDAVHVLHRHIISAEEMTEEKAASIWPNVTIWNGLQAKMLEHVGLIQDATTNNYNLVYFRNCGANDIVVVNTTNGYGSNSVHPVCSTDEEYFALFAGADEAFPVATTSRIALGKKDPGAYVIEEEDGSYTVAFNLYRIDTALVKVTVFKSGEDGINDITVDAVKVLDEGWYTIDGIRYTQPTHSGLYIHNGKKVFVK